MFHHILLPVDLADRHQPALGVAADLAGQSKGEVTLLHIIEVINGLSLEEEKEFYGRLEKKARVLLERLGGRFDQRKVPWHLEVRYGNRGPEVLRFAVEKKVDLVVLTSPLMDPQNPAAGWGSLSYKIGLVAPCPVLLVK